jgi:adenylate kinase family enzyme
VRRILVLGVSGSGKSTVGRRIAERLGVPYVELDALHHDAGWIEASPAELQARVRPLVDAEAWVIDGDYRRKLGDLVVQRADAIVWLDLPIRTWLPRLAWRTARRMATGEELWNGNRERVRNLFERPNIFGWAWRKHFANRSELEAWAGGHPHARLVRLRTPRDVERFLSGLR